MQQKGKMGIVDDLYKLFAGCIIGGGGIIVFDQCGNNMILPLRSPSTTIHWYKKA
jgi:hypothetical protein